MKKPAGSGREVLMGYLMWRGLGAFWRMIARRVPTCYLQDALEGRPGVQTHWLGPDDGRHAFEVAGPCVVTINRD